jgi:glycosyltransferase involved in cell wall biosynthesis
MKVSIIIPAYNEAGTIATLLERVWNQPLSLTKEIIVIDSGSKDGTREIIESFAKDKPEVNVVLQDKPRGKGNAVREGFTHATGDIILIQDADLEYEVTDYPALLAPIVEGKTAFVLGSRHMSKAGWQIRNFEGASGKAHLMNYGALLFHGFFNILFGTNLTDPTTMYKVFKRDCLERLHFSANHFDFDFELLGKLILAGYKPIEIPITYTSRGFAEGKKVSILRDPPRWVWIILKTRFSPL